MKGLKEFLTEEDLNEKYDYKKTKKAITNARNVVKDMLEDLDFMDFESGEAGITSRFSHYLMELSADNDRLQKNIKELKKTK